MQKMFPARSLLDLTTLPDSVPYVKTQDQEIVHVTVSGEWLGHKGLCTLGK